MSSSGCWSRGARLRARCQTRGACASVRARANEMPPVSSPRGGLTSAAVDWTRKRVRRIELPTFSLGKSARRPSEKLKQRCLHSTIAAKTSLLERSRPPPVLCVQSRYRVAKVVVKVVVANVCDVLGRAETGTALSVGDVVHTRQHEPVGVRKGDGLHRRQFGSVALRIAHKRKSLQRLNSAAVSSRRA